MPLGLLTLAGLSVLLQLREAVPDSRLPLHVDPTGFLGDLFRSWDASEDLGHRNGSLASYLPVAAFFAALHSVGVSAVAAQRIFFVGVLFLSALGMWFLVALFWETRNRLMPSVAALVYAFNPYVLLNMGGSPAGTTVLLLPYMAVPWVAIQFIRCVRQRSLLHGVIAAAILGIAAPGVNAAVNAIAFLGCVAVLLVELARTGFERRATLLALASTTLCGLASLWWLAPFLSSLRSGGTDFYFQTDPISTGASHSSFREVLRLLGLWALYEGHNGVPYYPTQRYFASNPVLAGTMAGAVAVFAALFRKWANSGTKVLAALLVLAVPMAVSIHPVGAPTLTGIIYQSLYDSFLPFRSFRSNYKWVSLVALVYALVMPLVLRLKVVGLRFVATAAVGAFVVANLVPFFAPGLMFPPGYRLGEIPGYWREAGRWLDAEEVPGRVLFTPSQGFSVYTWGRPQGDIAPLMMERPVVTPHIAPATNAGGKQLIDLAGEAVRSPSIPYDKVLDLLGVAFVVQRNDVDWQYYSSDPPERMRAFLRSQPGLQYEATFGMLDIYRVRREPASSVAVSSGVAHVTADGGLVGALQLFERGTVTVFDEPDPSNPALRSLRASSHRSGKQPFLAVDGDPSTAWFPMQELGREQWLELEFARPEVMREVDVALASEEGRALPQRVRVSIDSTATSGTVESDGVARFDFGGARSESLTIGLPAQGSGQAAGIAEVSIPGLPRTALDYRSPPNTLASFSVDMSHISRAVPRHLFISEAALYRIRAQVSVHPVERAGTAQMSQTGPRPADLLVLKGPTTVQLPIDENGEPSQQLEAELELRPGRYVVQSAALPQVQLRSLDVVVADQSDAFLRSLAVTRRSSSSLAVDVPSEARYLYFAETTDTLWRARQGKSPLRRAGVGNGYGNLWATTGKGHTEIEFEGASPYVWLTVSFFGVASVAITQLILRRRGTGK